MFLCSVCTVTSRELLTVREDLKAVEVHVDRLTMDLMNGWPVGCTDADELADIVTQQLKLMGISEQPADVCGSVRRVYERCTFAGLSTPNCGDSELQRLARNEHPGRSSSLPVLHYSAVVM